MKILFTHDLHDRIDTYKILEDGLEKNVGGYSRLYSKIKSEIDREEDLLLDGGDFSMGTLYQTIFESQGASLRLLAKMGYDVVSLGNHEFDFRAGGLARSLNNLLDHGVDLPAIVLGNADFELDEDRSEEDREEVKKLEKAFARAQVRDYKILYKSGRKIGIFGLMGREAAAYAPKAGIGFKDYLVESRRIVDELKKEEVDMIICLSHSGTWEDKSKSEDEILARQIPEIDLIISAHSHRLLREAIIVGNTSIVSCGKYGRYLAIVDMEEEGGRWKIKDYRLEEIDDSIGEDLDLNREIHILKERVQKEYLDFYNLEFDQIIAYSPHNFTPSGQIAKTYGEETLANLITDSFIYTIKDIEGEDYEKIYAALVPSGTIRDSFLKGPISVSQVFNVSSLGIGKDGLSSYPLVSAYITGRDLKALAEIDASISPMMKAAQLYIAGLSYKVNPNRMAFNRVTHISFENGQEIQDDILYRIVASLYAGQMLSIVGDMSLGLLDIVVRDREGYPIGNLEDHIVYQDKKELKEWYALANYLNSFPKEDGLNTIPEKYFKRMNRKIIDDDKSFLAKIKSPNKIFFKIATMLVSIIIIAFILLKYFIENR